MWLLTAVAYEFDLDSAYDLFIPNATGGYHKRGISLAAYILRVHEGYSRYDISEILGVTLDYTTELIGYAKKKLKNDDKYRERYERITYRYYEDN